MAFYTFYFSPAPNYDPIQAPAFTGKYNPKLVQAGSWVVALVAGGIFTAIGKWIGEYIRTIP